MRDFLRQFGRAATDDPVYKTLALLLAIAAWLWVQSQETDTALVRVNLDYDLPEDLVNVEPLLTSATVIAQGPRLAIRRAQTERPELTIDVSDQPVGRLDVSLDANAIENLPSGLTVVGFNPEKVTVRLDEKVQRPVPVTLRIVGKPADDHDARGKRTVEPQLVQLEGPRVLLDAIEAVRTLPVDITGWSETQTVEVGLDVPRGLSLAGEWSGTAEIPIVPLTSNRTVQDVPVVVVNARGWVAAEGYETISVRFEGPNDELRAMNSDDIIARVTIPAEPDRDRYRATFQAARAPRLDVSYPASKTVVRITTTPPPVEVEKL